MLRISSLAILCGTAVFMCNSLRAQNSGGNSQAPIVSHDSGSNGIESETGSQATTARPVHQQIPFRSTKRPALGPTNRMAQSTLQPLRKTQPMPQRQTPGQFPSPPANGQFPGRPVGYSTPPPRQSIQDTYTRSQTEGKFDLAGTVQTIDEIKLPAQEPGVIQSLSVQEGDSISAGQVIGKIDDSLAQRVLEQAKLQFQIADRAAKDTIGIRAADKEYRVADIEAIKIKRLAETRSKSPSDVLMAEYSRDIAKLKMEKAKDEQLDAGLEKLMATARVLEAETHINRHVLRSEYDAYVLEVYKKKQEYVQPGDEVIRIARMDVLWVQGTIASSELNPAEFINHPVTVTAKLARDQTATFEGVISNCKLEAVGGSRYLVKAKIQNRRDGEQWVLQPLSGVEMRIHLDADPIQPRKPAPRGFNAAQK
jgi:multidrug efflux pump subunit AcrA (membrane-fusion protein)